MTTSEISKQAEEIAKKYNPEGISPFPYQRIVEEKKDLKIYQVDLPEGVSGATGFDKDNDRFEIFISKNKANTRQHFTLAHELGHYFLHKEIIKKEEVLVDGDNYLDGNKMLYRLDQITHDKIETEANNFAASLIMPTELVTNAWNAFKSIEECARIFNVSTIAMSIRLERLNLIKDL